MASNRALRFLLIAALLVAAVRAQAQVPATGHPREGGSPIPATSHPREGGGPISTVRILLAGDSTMAPRNGYGDALCRLFRPGVTCVNLARNGRSSRTFRTEGSWDRMTALLADREANRSTWVLIQFGHNDQPGKAERSTDLETEYPANLARYVDEVRAAGAKPVLLTPLTRRTFRDAVLVNDLKPWADTMRRVAQDKQVPLLELNAESAAAVASMGPADADTLAMAPAPDKDFDHTHLGAKGSEYFAAMVAKELALAVPEFAGRLRYRRPQLSAAQANAYSMNTVLGGWDPVADELGPRLHGDDSLFVDPAAKADGRTTFHTIQAAVNAAVSRGDKSRVHILVAPGVYRELLYVPESTTSITIRGGGKGAAATRVSADLDARVTGAQYASTFGAQFAGTDPRIAAMFASLKDRATVGTPGSAVAWIRNAGFQASNMTFENTYNKDRGDSVARGSQAVALMVDDADRVQFDNVRFLGFQDTLFLHAASAEKPARVFIDDSYIEGDMDFIFGAATAYFRRTEIRSLGDRPVSFTLAPGTHYESPYGFVFDQCRFTNDGTPNALAGSFKLARQWFRGSRCTPFAPVATPAGYSCSFGAEDTFDSPNGRISKAPLESVGKIVILNSRIGAHVSKVQPWADWNARGTPSHRPVQYDSDDYWENLTAAGIDPVRQMGYAARKSPVEPFLAEYGNTDE